jgi:two-component system response regulator QseB
MRLLLVEDDIPLGDGIRAGLALEDCVVDWVTDGVAAERALQQERFDAVVLDLGLPQRPGMDVLRDLRARGDTTPVLVLTARDSIADRVEGLDTGGDDYMIKPFDLGELAARLRALQRRRGRIPPPVLRHGRLAMDLAAKMVTLDGVPVHTSPHEYSILRTLLENAGQTVSRVALEQSLYGLDIDIESNTTEVYIHFLRKKFGNRLIRTVRGTGYIIDRCA